MASVAELTERMRAAAATQPGGTGSLKLVLGGEGTIRIAGGEVDNADAPADCTLTLALADLERMLTGELDPRAALADGRLRLEGDPGVAVSFQSLIAAAWG